VQKTLAATVLAGTLGLCATGCLQPAAIRIASFNMRDAVAEAADSNRRADCAELTRRIASSSPDIIAIQGVHAADLDSVRQELPAYDIVAAGSVDGARAGTFVPILYRRQRFRAIDYGHFWLSERPQNVGSIGWDAEHPCMATWVRLRFADAPLVQVQLVNVELPHSGKRARRESARLIRRLVESVGTRPLVVMGDFHGGVCSEPYRILTEDRGDMAALVEVQAQPATDDPLHVLGGLEVSSSPHRVGHWILINRRFECVDGGVARSEPAVERGAAGGVAAATIRLRPTSWPGGG